MIIFLENCFPDYKVYVGQDNMIFSSPSGIGEIYKIHGSCEQPKSMVLTEEDYADYKRKNPYLAAKLLTFFTEHPVIFLGYSLSDENVVSIISSIAQCLDANNIDKLRDRLIIISFDPSIEDAVINYSTRVFEHDVRVPFLSITTNKFDWVYEALGNIQRHFPAKILRQLKEQVYDLVINNAEDDEKKKLYVLDIDKADAHNQLEVVFGVGAIQQISGKGYEGMTREDLMHDLLEEKNYNAKAISQRLLPRLLLTAAYMPLYKYLRRAGYMDSEGKLQKKEELDPQVIDFVENDSRTFGSTASTYRNRFVKDFLPNLYNGPEKAWAFLSLQTPRSIMECMPYCPDDLLDLNWMFDFLLANRDFISTRAQTERGLYAKFISKYDSLRYKRSSSNGT